MGLTERRIREILKSSGLNEEAIAALVAVIVENNNEVESTVSAIATQTLVGKLTPDPEEVAE